MNIVDSSGWVEHFIEGSNADIFTALISEPDNLIIPTICVYEVFKRTLISFGDEKALQVAGVMSMGQVIDLDRELAIDAARLSSETKMPMADSIILATARAHNATLWTQDEHFKGFEGVQYVKKD